MTEDSNERRDCPQLIEVALPVREPTDASHLKIDLPSPSRLRDGLTGLAPHFINAWMIR